MWRRPLLMGGKNKQTNVNYWETATCPNQLTKTKIQTQTQTKPNQTKILTARSLQPEHPFLVEASKAKLEFGGDWNRFRGRGQKEANGSQKKKQTKKNKPKKKTKKKN